MRSAPGCQSRKSRYLSEIRPWSGAVCADAPAGSTPGSASAAASKALRGRAASIAATASAADPVAAARRFLAGVDVLLQLAVEGIGVELHLGLRQRGLFPRPRWLYGR